MQRKMDFYDLLRHARLCRRSTPSDNLRAEVERYKLQFDTGHCAKQNTSLNIFTFHVPVPASHRVINYVDVQHDHWEFDYRKLASHFTWATSKFNPLARVLFVTNLQEPEPLSHCDVTTVRLATNAAAPMLERVKAMAGYVESSAFDHDTAFLDTDAFPNRSLQPIFDEEFDVGVTYRTTKGFMPLNEGVVFCRHAGKEAVRRFFAAYLATYERLIEDPLVQEYYGDIERWRGGQLSLNAIALIGEELCSGIASSEGIRIRMFDCNNYNYWVQPSNLRFPKAWDRKFILHLKGDSKRLVDALIEYQQHRDLQLKSRRGIGSAGVAPATA